MDQDRYRQIFEQKALMSGGLRLGGGKYRDCEMVYIEGNSKGKKPGTCAKYSALKQAKPPQSNARKIAGQCNSWMLFYNDFQNKNDKKGWTKAEMMEKARAKYAEPKVKTKWQNISNKCRTDAGLHAISHPKNV